MGETRDIPVLESVDQVCGGWIKKYELTYRMPDGSLYRYESVSRKNLEDYRTELSHRGSGEHPTPDAICIVPRTAEGELVLIKEFRYPLNDWCIAFPAGLIDPGESLETCIERELLEETGYGFDLIEGRKKYHPLPQSSYSSTGMSEENIQIVFAFVKRLQDPKPEPSEFIEVFTLPISDIAAFLDANTTPIGTRCQLLLESFARDARDTLQS